MKYVNLSLVATVMAVVGTLGCSQQTPPAAPGSNSAANASAYRLSAEPAGAVDVKAAKTNAGDGEDVAVVGRIGGDAKPWVDGLAAFTIVDLSLKPCEEGCETP